MTTIVSAFVSNINSKKEMDIFKYYQNGKLLLKSSVPKIIFLDETMLNLVGEDYDKSNTFIIKINKEDIYLNSYRDLLNNFHLKTDNSDKDTLEYIFTICNKTEWTKTAILLNNFNTDNFIWIDFGIRHVFKCSDEEFIEKVNNLYDKIYLNVRIAKIWNIDVDYGIDIYKNIAWYFAGGVFGGNKNQVILFAENMKNKCIEIITKKNTLVWEVNIWYLVYLENKELFDTYYCDHNNSIIDNY
jgi:hypothetical protein